MLSDNTLEFYNNGVNKKWSNVFAENAYVIDFEDDINFCGGIINGRGRYMLDNIKSKGIDQPKNEMKDLLEFFNKI